MIEKRLGVKAISSYYLKGYLVQSIEIDSLRDLFGGDWGGSDSVDLWIPISRLIKVA